MDNLLLNIDALAREIDHRVLVMVEVPPYVNEYGAVSYEATLHDLAASDADGSVVCAVWLRDADTVADLFGCCHKVDASTVIAIVPIRA